MSYVVKYGGGGGGGGEALISEITQGKEDIAAAINAKGGTADPLESFQQLAQGIINLNSSFITYGVEVTEKIHWLNFICNSGVPARQPLTAIDDDTVTEISQPNVFQNCTSLTKVVMNAVESISGGTIFQGCVALTVIQMDNLRTIVPLGQLSSLEEFSFPNVTIFNKANATWSVYPALKRIILPSLSQVYGQGYDGFFGGGNSGIEFMKLGAVVTDLGGNGGQWNNLRNFEVGYGTNANINFRVWRATNVINEGADAISELNTNIMNGIVANLLQGAGKTFTVGLTLYNVLYPETLQAFADKGWNIASS